MKGPLGIGVISDRDPQPLIIGSRFGNFAIAIAGLIENVNELGSELLKREKPSGRCRVAASTPWSWSPN